MQRYYRKFAKKATVGAALVVLSLGAAAPAFALTPNDPGYSLQAPFYGQIGAPAAWDISTGSSNVVVALIDTGVDTWQDDLRHNIWTNPYALLAGGPGPDQNGISNDWQGWNFVENNNRVRPTTVDPKADPEAVNHGTIIAGLIGAEGNNALDGVGLNWHVKIMPLRAIENSGSGSYGSVASAINYAVDNGAHIITMSFIGDSDDPVLRASLLRAYQHGVLVVAAAGNHQPSGGGNLDLSPLYPACFGKDGGHHTILTVGSVDITDRLSRFSDYGSCVDIVAPGENIYSTQRYDPTSGYNSEFGGTAWKGTSFAAPLVAAAAALVKAVHPEWGPDQLMNALLRTADSVDALNPGYTGKLGAGRLNVGAALKYAAGIPLPQPYQGNYYYLTGRSVNRWGLGARQPAVIAPLRDAETVGLATEPLTYDSNGIILSKPVALIKRGQYYYLRFLKADGSFWREAAVDFPALAGAAAKKIAVYFDPDQGDTIIMETYQPRAKKTTYYYLDALGQPVDHFSVAGSPAAWNGDNQGNVVMARLKGKQLILDQHSRSGALSYSVAVGPADNVQDLAAGLPLWGDAAGETAVVFRRGGSEELAVVHLPSDSLALTAVGPSDRATWRLLSLEPFASPKPAALAPFSTNGGQFTAYDGKGRSVAEITVPKISFK